MSKMQQFARVDKRGGRLLREVYGEGRRQRGLRRYVREAVVR